MNELTHLDEQGRASMVDVTCKAATEREAQARAWVRMLPATLQLIQDQGHPKGDVFAVARIAGIMAAKKTHELIPCATRCCSPGSTSNCRHCRRTGCRSPVAAGSTAPPGSSWKP